jgi:hypothetical protein
MTRSLLSAAAVRSASRRMLGLALTGSLQDWTVNLERLPAVADFVAGVVRERYPDLRPPFHARWRHFVFAGQDLWSTAAARTRWPDAASAARAAFDLAITSVLLDAGAGAEWRYKDADSGVTAARSEGLALASLRWFERGGLSEDPHDPLRADAAVLERIDAYEVERVFQSAPGNRLEGAEGRASLLNKLGAVVHSRPDLFALGGRPRPGGLFDVLALGASRDEISAATVLEVVLEGLGPIWPGRPVLDGVSLGDCWLHPAFEGSRAADHYVPLHKLSQWLAYSLLEPLEKAGFKVVDVGALTGLAEYRNGGLFVDMGVLVPRDPSAATRIHDVSDSFVVGWRSLTVALLDDIAPLVAGRLGLKGEEFPLARVLEGGTWAAGRLVARQARADGGPPFKISSDGTVF